MEQKNLCANCSSDLVKASSIHVVDGEMFCSEDCAINHHMDEILMNAKEQAKEWYNTYAEIVTPADIGIVYEKIWTAYSREADVTSIFLSRYLDKECNETVSTEVIGFYWGEPNEADTAIYTGIVRATY